MTFLESPWIPRLALVTWLTAQPALDYIRLALTRLASGLLKASEKGRAIGSNGAAGHYVGAYKPPK